MKNMMGKSVLREIKSSYSRWVAILAIIALGVGFFAGLKVCKESFWYTGDKFLEEHNFYDYRMISSMGLTDKNIADISKVKGVSMAEGSYSSDAIVGMGKNDSQKDGKGEEPISEKDKLNSNSGELVAKVHTISNKINTLELVYGKMPTKSNQCILDRNRFSKDIVGKEILIAKTNDKKTRRLFKYDKYLVTGLAESPLYLNFERGSTSLGDGTVGAFMYIPKGGWDSKYYTEMYLTLEERGRIFSEEYSKNAGKMKKPLEDALKTTANERYHTVISKAKAKLSKSEKKLETKKSDLAEGENTLIIEQKKLEQSREKLLKKEEEVDNGEKKISQVKKNLKKSELSLSRGWKMYREGLSKANSEKRKAYKKLEPLEAALLQSKGTPAYETYLAQYKETKKSIDQNLKPIFKKLKATKAELEKNQSRLKKGKIKLSEEKNKLASAKKKIASGKASLEVGEEKLSKGKNDIKKARAKIIDAESQLKDGKKKIKKIERPDIYTLDRKSNIGYVCFENDTNIVEGIAKVFPVFFFLVAALVVMTTMTRMVDEQRTQIGVLKALGYGKKRILWNYVFYSGSSALIGGLIGFFVGSSLFPLAIWKAYSIMYQFSPLKVVINPSIGTLSILVALFCAVGTTVYSCYKELSEVPAQLIRPKSPALGKRIWLEKIHFLWHPLSFLHKVTARNIFRYKKRFFMMLLGICGCTALLLTGLGISDSVKNVVTAQYEDIMKADFVVTFTDDLTQKERTDFIKDHSSVIKDALFTYTVSMDAHAGNQIKSVNLVVCGETDPVHKFIDLHDRKNNSLPYPKKGKCLINSNLGLRLGLKVGDTITISDSDMNSITATIESMCENYVYNYMYINKETYREQMGDFEINSALVLGVHNKDGQVEDPNGDGAVIMKYKNVAAVSIFESFKNRIMNMMKSLDYVVALVIACAGMLAFIVLYNLTNINITERIREIATIKVLGFNRKETAAYVFREILTLTGIATLVGLPVGILLHRFVMSKIVIDMISFDIHIEIRSYIIAVGLTFLFAAIVNLIMYFKLDKVNMAESLKSVE